MNTIEKVIAVRNTLEKVSVAGPENWDRMLGCWQLLGQVEEELKHESTDAPVQQRDSADAADPV